MTTTRLRGTLRGTWTRPKPDGPPACPGCGARLDLSQPAADRPHELFGSCDNIACMANG